MKDKVGVLASGEGTTFEAVWRAIDHGAIDNTEICFIVSNSSNNGIWARAHKFGVPIYHISNLTQDTCTLPQVDGSDAKGTISYEASEAIADLSQEYDVKMLAALGFMKRVVGRVLREVPIMNLHQGPLGPDKITAGLKTSEIQDYILANGYKYSGPTVHWMGTKLDSNDMPEYDDGEEIGHEPVAVTSAMREQWRMHHSSELLEDEVKKHEKIWVPIWIRDALDQLSV